MRCVAAYEVWPGRSIAALNYASDGRLFAEVEEAGVGRFGFGVGVGWHAALGDQARSGALADDDRRVIVERGGTIDILDSETGRSVATLERARPLLIHRASRYLIAGNRLVDARLGTVAHLIDGTPLALAADGTRALTTVGSNALLYTHLDRCPTVSEWSEHEVRRARRVRISSAADIVLAMGYLTLVCFELPSGREVERIVTTGAELVTAEISNDGRLIVTADKHSMISVFERERGRRWIVGPLRGRVHHLSIARDAVVVECDGTYAFELGSGTARAPTPRDLAVRPSVTCDGASEIRTYRRQLARELSMTDAGVRLGHVVPRELPGYPPTLHARSPNRAFVARTIAQADDHHDREVDETTSSIIVVETAGGERIATWDVPSPVALLACSDDGQVSAWQNCYEDSSPRCRQWSLGVAPTGVTEVVHHGLRAIAARGTRVLFHDFGRRFELRDRPASVDAFPLDLSAAYGYVQVAAFSTDGETVWLGTSAGYVLQLGS